ncbi:methyltransferase cognate corrinoid proteins [Desulfotomaculum arcticum]|uniref:Methyltransferase cognate corrinoid proteins n=1 Tax=Desulfotruncus arcticus DSM 17038 TaxID=1121424 RepID=A0A1I2WUQ9_9FIRM|nr:methyltransferase cognate corrinoid proteins [Desulfotomaculum arcticum] [Desulfotruncus arcticus DSM 17038]
MNGLLPKEMIWAKLKKGVIMYDEEIVVQAAENVLRYGLDIYESIMNGLVPGIEQVGRLYESGEYFVPEMLMCSDALYAGLSVLRPHLKKSKPVVNGQIVIGVVQGDIHDIGKNIVKMMFDAAGFQVHDLGRDVPLDRFVEEQLRTDSEIVCISTLMTTTMYGMVEIIQKIKEKNPSVKIMVGGAPLTEELARKWGADGYSPNAHNAIKYAIKMVSSLKELTNSGN